MNLRNYTSDVPASRTIFKIQQILIKAGVSSLEMEYGPNQQVSAITFRIQFDPEKPPLPIRMPARVAEAQDALWLAYADGDKLTMDGNRLQWNNRKTKTRADFLEQGERTAWKLMQDWLEVQLSLIRLRQVDFVQVFLSYVWDGRQTFYDRIKDRGFAALMPPKDKDTRPVEVVS
jgi:hypothetical protein